MSEDPIFLRAPDSDEASLDEVRNKTLEKALKLSQILLRSDHDIRTVTYILPLMSHCVTYSTFKKNINDSFVESRNLSSSRSL